MKIISQYLLLAVTALSVFLCCFFVHSQTTTTTVEDCNIPVSQSSANLSISVINDILRMHNNARRLVTPRPNNMKMITWNDILAKHANDYLKSCTSFMSHSTPQQRLDVAGYRYVGENLAGGSDPAAFSQDDFTYFVQLWLDEKQYYTYAAQPCGNTDICGSCAGGIGCVNKVGHWSQIVWNNANSATMQVGCAFYNGCGDARYICQYGNGGNIYGAAPWELASDPSGPMPPCVSATPHTIVDASGVPVPVATSTGQQSTAAPTTTSSSNSGGTTTGAPPNNNNNSPAAPSPGVSGGAIAGIVIGVIVGLVLVVAAVAIIAKKRHEQLAAERGGEGVSQNFLFAQTYANEEGLQSGNQEELLQLGGSNQKIQL